MEAEHCVQVFGLINPKIAIAITARRFNLWEPPRNQNTSAIAASGCTSFRRVFAGSAESAWPYHKMQLGHLCMPHSII